MMNMSLPWLLAGDGNATITSEDRKGGARGTRPSSSSFQNFVQMKEGLNRFLLCRHKFYLEKGD